MNSHKNAPLTPKAREAMVRSVAAGLSKAAAARQFNTTPKTVANWVERFRAGGVDGLRDRSSRPLRECEEHGWMQDRADPDARNRALAITLRNPPSGVTSDEAAAEIRDVLGSIGDTCPECPPHPCLLE
jgi:hypothetical protein